MGFTGSIASIVTKKSWYDLGRLLREMQAEIKSLQTARPIAMASRDFDGTLSPPAAGTTGWGLSNADGGTAILNNLILRGGIIGNDALANPLGANWYFATNSGYAIPQATGAAGGGTMQASVTVTIPAGFTKALLFAAVQDFGVNSTGADDYMNSLIKFPAATDFVFASSSTVPAGKGGASVVVTTDEYTGLSGGDTLVIQSKPFAYNGAWAAAPSNSTSLSALALFLR